MNGKRPSIVVNDELPSLLPYQRNWVAPTKIVVAFPSRRSGKRARRAA